MKALLDTNILIHRESSHVVNEDIGVLFGWLDRMKYEKCVHPLSIKEIENHDDPRIVKTFKAKLQSYVILNTVSQDTDQIKEIRKKHDNNKNDEIDTSLLKELFNNRVDCFITEDRKIHTKAKELGISDLVFTIDDFLEKAITENPELTDYTILSVRKAYFGDIDISDSFFDSFRKDYKGFDKWFNSKANEFAYVCRSEQKDILAFLYIKKEDSNEAYYDISPTFKPKIRLKIGTFKVASNGFNIGERFLKIIFDNALKNNVDEVYVTLFNKSEEHARLIGLLEDWGFELYGNKETSSGIEHVYIKNFKLLPNSQVPKKTYPFIARDRRYFLIPIRPEYHTELLPDSILKNEKDTNYVESGPHRNALQKVYVSNSIYRNVSPGDLILFYRTGG